MKSEEVSTGTKDKRARNFACVLYPVSAVENWQTIIAESKLPVLVSPLHDRDFNPTGEHKVNHYHIMVAYENKKTAEQAREFFKSFGGVGCEVIGSLRGYARYLCHLDNPEKAQYKTEDVLQYGGADYSTFIGLPSDKYKGIAEMQEFCRDNLVLSYAQLMDYARIHRYDWFRLLCDSASLVMSNYVKSIKWEEETAAENKAAGASSEEVSHG